MRFPKKTDSMIRLSHNGFLYILGIKDGNINTSVLINIMSSCVTLLLDVFFFVRTPDKIRTTTEITWIFTYVCGNCQKNE